MERAHLFAGLSARSRSAAVPAVARALPVGIAFVAAEVIAWHDRGSIAAADFLPSALVVALVAAAVLWSGAARRPSRAAAVGLAALAGLAVWAGVSGWWAPVPSLARDEALLVAFGALALAVPALTVRTPRDRLVALGVVTAGLALVALGTIWKLHGSANPDDVFRYRRLSFPITYANASAGLFLAGVWPALLLAARRGAPARTRIPSFAAATLMLGTSLLAQSKGGVLGFAISVLVLAAVSAARLRLIAAAVLAALPVAVAFRPLTAAYRAAGTTEIRDIHRAAVALLLLSLASLALGAAYVAADRRLEIGESRRKLVGRVALAATVLAVLVGAGAFATASPGTWLADQWRSFKHAPAVGTGSTHLVELGSNRYDFWRVALGEFERHPLVGDGARGFGPAYLVHGRSNETPARAHSLPLELLGEEGIVGFALAALAYGALLVGLARRARRRSAAATAALGGCTLLLAQALADWTFTFPALTVPFFLLAGIGLADDGRRRIADRAGTRGAMLLAVAAVIVFVPPWLSAKLVRSALSSGNRNGLTWAHRLDPVSVEPLIAEAELATNARAAISPLEAARARAPRALAVRYLLGSVYWNAGRRADALREFEAALALHPGDPAVERALAVVRGASG